MGWGGSFCIEMIIWADLFRVVDFAKLHSSVKLWGVCAGEGVLGIVACQGSLVEDGGVATNETPLVVFNDLANVVLNWAADMENLAIVVDISVESIVESLACEARVQRGFEIGFDIGGELIGIASDLW